MSSVSRRDLFKYGSAVGIATVGSGIGTEAAQAPSVSHEQAIGSHALRNAEADSFYFLNEAEAAFLSAAVDHLIPPDDLWPGATQAGVVTYLDRQLASGFGAGDRLFLQGPWQQGLPQQGYQLPYTPAELYRTAMTEIRRHLDQNFAGRRFEQLDHGTQDKLLRSMESGELGLGDVPSAVFFETLLANTVEGYFADPMYGGNREMAGWKMIGFPGAYANYVSLVEHHGLAFKQEPISAASAAHAHDGH